VAVDTLLDAESTVTVVRAQRRPAAAQGHLLVPFGRPGRPGRRLSLRAGGVGSGALTLSAGAFLWWKDRNGHRRRPGVGMVGPGVGTSQERILSMSMSHSPSWGSESRSQDHGQVAAAGGPTRRRRSCCTGRHKRLSRPGWIKCAAPQRVLVAGWAGSLSV
jgi:hypothetical protein